MHGGHAPTIRRAKSKPPSAAAVAASAVQQQVQQLCCKWELSAVSHGSLDPAAQLQAAKTLQQLVQYLSQHKSTCRHGATRTLLQKHLPSELLLALLSSQQEEVVNLSLHVLQDLAHIVPAVIPVDAVPRLLQLLCCQTHGGAAAQVLTAQLSDWRFSQVWPHWTAASITHRLYQQLQQQLALAQAPESAGSNTASKAAEACVSMLMLLAKLVKLAEQQVLWQLAPDADTASRWLQLLLQVAGLRSQLAGRPPCAHLQDSCCALLAAMSQAPATSAVLTSSTRVRQGVLQLLHGVLRRPCCVSEADASQVQCWMHAAAAANLTVLWQETRLQEHPQQHNGSALAPHEEQQLLADMAISAAATLCNECFSVSAIAKQVDGAAASLLAVALLPSEGAYGRHGSCTSRFMAAVLGSHCCHVLLHALAVSTNTTSEQAAALAAAAAAATVSAAHASTQVTISAAVFDEQPAQAQASGGAADTAQSVILAPVQQGLQPAWLLLRLICAQCAAVADGSAAAAAVGTRSSASPLGVCEAPRGKGSGSSSARGPRTHVKQQMALLVSCSTGSSAVQPEQVLRVVQAYSSHITTGTDAQRVPGLLRSLHFLMCQFVLVVRHGPSTSQQDAGSTGQQQQQDRQQEHGRQRLQWMSLTSDGASSSCSSNSEAAHVGTGQQQMLSTAAAVLDLITSSQQGLLTAGAGSQGRHTGLHSHASAAASSSSSNALSPHQLSWSLAASVYVSLAVAVYLQERSSQAGPSGVGAAAAGAGHMSAADCCLALGALQLATAALKVLLPVVTVLKCRQNAGAGATAAESAQPERQPKAGQQQRKTLVLPVHEPLECSLAAVQALTALSSLLQPALPGLLSDCISSGTGYIGHQYAPEPHDNSSSNGGHSAGDVNRVIRVSAIKTAVAAAASGLDKDLQSLLSRVVLSWQSSPSDSTIASTHSSPGTAAAQLSVDAALQQHLRQELRCWSAAALALCYGQMGAQTWQGTVLEPFRDPGAPFADVQMQLGPNQQVAGHAAVLAAGCPVLRQQLAAAVSDAAGDSSIGQQLQHVADLHSSSSSRSCSSGVSGGAGTLLLLKLSAAVDLQAFQQALDFIYTGATVLPHAGLGSQLQLCSSCLSPSADRQRPLDKLRALQQRQLQELHEQQAAARQQLHKLGMLACKLQLPLLAALTRGRRPEPGQRLPDLHLHFAALLPQQVMLSAPSSCYQEQQQPAAAVAEVAAGAGSCSSAVWSPVDGRQTQCHQQQGNATPQQHNSEQGQQQAIKRHPTNAEYLAMLADCAAADSSGLAAPQVGNGAAADPLGLNASAAHSRYLQQLLDALQLQRQAGAQDHSFADVFIAAPVVLTSSSSSQQQHWHQQQQQQSSCQLQGEVAFAFLPAHRVMLSSCCPYFEALLSTRWQHDDDFVPHLSSVQDSGAAAPQQHQQQHAARVVVVPEADIHVAAALQHYLYTGSLRVELQQQVVCVGAGTAGATCTDHLGEQHQQQQQQQQASRQREALQGQGITPGSAGICAGLQSGGAAAAGIPLNGCCQGCHQARTLLRLWRCAELLLLPGLQALCLAAVDAAGWQLDLQCCVVLLGDCCELGVPAAADALLAALSVRADRDAAAALCEWEELPSGLQGVLIKAWADRRRLQQDGAAAGPAGGQAGVIGTPALIAAGQAPTTPYGGVAGGVQPQRGVLHTGVLPADAGLVGLEQELQPPAMLLQTQQPGMPYQPVAVSWSRVQDLMDAGQRLSDALSPQHKHSRA